MSAFIVGIRATLFADPPLREAAGSESLERYAESTEAGRGLIEARIILTSRHTKWSARETTPEPPPEGERRDRENRNDGASDRTGVEQAVTS